MSQEIEIREAIAAGERALQSLRSAQEKLNSARGWGMFDLFGGGFISDMIKHSKLEDASRYMEQAKRDLQVFRKELADVNISSGLRLDIGSFLTFADFFFDGLVADYLVQSKIAEARREVEHAIERVNEILAQLRRST